METEEALQPQNEDAQVQIVLRSSDPTKLKDLSLTVPLKWNVENLKQLITAAHPQQPQPGEQVLVYQGQVLYDLQAPLKKILKFLEKGEPHVIHLVLRNEATPSTSRQTETGERSEAPAANEAPPVTTGSSMVALPVVMMNPIVTAACNAAMAAVYRQGGNAETTPLRIPLPPDPSQPSSSSSNSNLQQNPQQQPMVPAIAFFPLGIPVLVPAAAQNQGFQIADHLQRQNPQRHPPQHRHAERRAPGQHGNSFSEFWMQRFFEGRRHGRAREVIVYRFSLRGIIQMALIVALLYAYCSQESFFFFLGAFILLYIFARPIRRVIQGILNGREPDGERRQRNIFQEILAFVFMLISSLFPNWNAEDAPEAPFARLVREERFEEPQNRPHVD